MLVSGLRGYHVIDVACGSGDAHSLAVADDGNDVILLSVKFVFCINSLIGTFRLEDEDD